MTSLHVSLHELPRQTNNKKLPIFTDQLELRILSLDKLGCFIHLALKIA